MSLVIGVCFISALVRNSSAVPMISRLFPIFSSISFIVSGFILRSMIHVDFSLCKLIKMDLFIFFYINIISLTSTILWWDSLFPLHVYVWSFNSFPLNISVFMSIPWGFYYHSSVFTFHIRDGDSSTISFTVHYCFINPDIVALFFFFQMNVKIIHSRYRNDCVGIFLGSCGICRPVVVRLPFFYVNPSDIWAWKIFPPSFDFFIFFFKTCGFYHASFSIAWLDLPQGTLYYLRLLEKMLFP